MNCLFFSAVTPLPAEGTFKRDISIGNNIAKIQIQIQSVSKNPTSQTKVQYSWNTKL